MKRLDDMPIDPEMAAYLDAIDATLAGEPVDPRHAEVAELALLLADERPRPRPEFTASLDARAARRFMPAPAVSGSASAAAHGERWASRRRWRLAGQWSAVAACAAALVVAVVLIGNGATPYSKSSSDSSSSSASSQSPVPAVASSGSPRSSGSAAASSGASEHAPSTSSSAAASSAGGSAAASSAAPGAQNLTLPGNGRKTIQSAELDLTAKPTQIDQVAQEVFNVVGEANGIVDHSAVTQTGGSDGSASFQLRLPSANLGETLGRLSSLRGAQVVSRTDNSQDVNSQYVSANRQLADDQALRTSLLKQLANAVTQAQIDSLRAQLKNAEASITSDQNALRQLNSQIDYSQVTLNINAASGPVPVTHHHSSGFTLGHAAHTAGRVLVVVAGVGLIALAGLLPVALIAAILLWGAAAMRRRRREQALDLA